MLRLTREAPVASLLRYCLGEKGLGFFQQYMRKNHVGVINVMARKIAVGGMPAGLPVLHAAAGILALRNSYIQLSAHMVHAALRAERSSAQDRRRNWMRCSYHIPD